MDEVDELRLRWRERASLAVLAGKRPALGYYCCAAHLSEPGPCPVHGLPDQAGAAAAVYAAHGLSAADMPGPLRTRDTATVSEAEAEEMVRV